MTAPIGIVRYASTTSAARALTDSSSFQPLISYGPVTSTSAPAKTLECTALVNAMLAYPVATSTPGADYSNVYGHQITLTTLAAKWNVDSTMVECSTWRTASTTPVQQSVGSTSGEMYLHVYLPDGASQSGASQLQSDLQAVLCGGLPIRAGTLGVDQGANAQGLGYCPARESSRDPPSRTYVRVLACPTARFLFRRVFPFLGFFCLQKKLRTNYRGFLGRVHTRHHAAAPLCGCWLYKWGRTVRETRGRAVADGGFDHPHRDLLLLLFGRSYGSKLARPPRGAKL